MFGLGSLRQVAFVAAKADLVAPKDLKNGRLHSLLRQMTRQAKNRLPEKAVVKWFICSACRSTRPGNTEKTLIGTPWLNNPKRMEEEFPVAELPEYWPSDWEFQDYQFPQVHPKTARNIQIPPETQGSRQGIRIRCDSLKEGLWIPSLTTGRESIYARVMMGLGIPQSRVEGARTLTNAEGEKLPVPA